MARASGSIRKLLKQQRKVDKAKEAYRNMPAVDRMLVDLTTKEKEKVFKDSRTRKGKRIITMREEGSYAQRTKNAYMFRGNKASAVMQSFLKDMHALRKPNCVVQGRKSQKELYPFEDVTRVEKFCLMADCPMFLMVSSSKKRPNSAVIGRTFNRELLDMVEFAVTDYEPSQNFEGFRKLKGTKAITLFQGSLWDSSDSMRACQSLLSDFFVGPVVKRLKLPESVERLQVVTAVAEGKVEFRHYRIGLRKSGTDVPDVDLDEVGPAFTLTMGRVQTAPEAVMKQALWVHKGQMKKSKTQMKNRERNEFGDVIGRVHLGGKQDLSKVHTPLSVDNMERAARKRQQKRTAGVIDDEQMRPDRKDVFRTEVDI